MRERVLGPSTDPAALPQERAQPARADVRSGLLLQVERQALRRPHVEDQAERAGTALQRGLHGLQIRLICSHRSTGPRGVTQRRRPTRGKARQPPLHACLRAPAPAGDALHIVAQRRRLDHLQPLAHPPRQVRAAQLPLHVLTLLPGHRDAHGSAPLTPTDFPSDLQVRGAYASNMQFTSGYLAAIHCVSPADETGLAPTVNMARE